MFHAKDARRGVGHDMQIRGLAGNSSYTSRGGHERDSAHYDEYRRFSRPDAAQQPRYSHSDERDFYDDRYEGDRTYDRRPGSGSRSPRPHRPRDDYTDRDEYRSSWRDDRDETQDYSSRSRATRQDVGSSGDRPNHESSLRDKPRGEPSREIMLEGLSQDITDDHVRHLLTLLSSFQASRQSSVFC